MNAMLELANAVYPDQPWKVDEERTIPYLGNGMYFYPEHFPEQAWDVLAWLLCHRGERPHRHHELTPWHVKEVYFTDDNEPINASVTMHDGTAAGIRKAIVHAALRCVEGK